MTADHKRFPQFQRLMELEFMMFPDTFPQMSAGVVQFDFPAEQAPVVPLADRHFFPPFVIDEMPGEMEPRCLAQIVQKDRKFFQFSNHSVFP